jgi:hypothetical protein
LEKIGFGAREAVVSQIQAEKDSSPNLLFEKQSGILVLSEEPARKRHTFSVSIDAATRSLVRQMPLVRLEDFPAFLFE